MLIVTGGGGSGIIAPTATVSVANAAAPATTTAHPAANPSFGSAATAAQPSTAAVPAAVSGATVTVPGGSGAVAQNSTTTNTTTNTIHTNTTTTSAMGSHTHQQQRTSIATTIDSSATGPTQHGGGFGGGNDYGFNNNATTSTAGQSFIGGGDRHYHQHRQQHHPYRYQAGHSSDSDRDVDDDDHDDEEEEAAVTRDADNDDDNNQHGFNGVALGSFAQSHQPYRSGRARTSYGGNAGYWGTVRTSGASRAVSPTGAPMHGGMDNMSENSSQPPMAALAASLVRSKSRTDMQSAAGAATTAAASSTMGTSSRYGNLSYWKARRVLFYRNGDPFFPGVEFRFKPFRDIASLEALLDKISPKMDLPRGARYVFSMDGDRKYNLDELEDGASYVLSSFKGFKVSVYMSVCI